MAEFCQEQKIPAAVSVATSYGSVLLPEGGFLSVHEGRMEWEEMCRWIKKEGIVKVADATHPFAREASEQIKKACEKTDTPYIRLVRDAGPAGAPEKEEGKIKWVRSAEEAAGYLKEELSAFPGRKVLLTTGSKELSFFSSLPDPGNTLYARVLPTLEGIRACLEAGIKENHIIAMQGPFSYEFNTALFREIQPDYLVTKESGKAGGFREKIEAASFCGCQAVVIKRPCQQEEGKSLEEVFAWLKEGQISCLECGNQKRSLVLLGGGMGSLGQMTVEGVEALVNCDGILGASRMLDSGKAVLEQIKSLPIGKSIREKVFFCSYRPEEMLSWLNSHPEITRPVILYSGDTGFYSGAKQLANLLTGQEDGKDFSCRLIPGISSLSYLAAKLGKSWEEAEVVSIHGREETSGWDMEDGRERFLLLDGSEKFHALCRKLIGQGQENARIWVGERLSYEDERIFSGTPRTMLEEEFGSLAAAWIIPQKKLSRK